MILCVLYLFIYKYCVNWILIYCFFFYISVLPDELNVGDHTHCIKCTSLLAASCCTCIQCGDCGIYSISKNLHKCRKNPTYCKN